MHETKKPKVIIIFSVLILFIIPELFGQDTVICPTIYPGGISVEYGLGSYSVKDEYISKEKYSGSLPYYSFGWARKHNKYVYRLEMAYRNSDAIRNFNVSSGLTQFSLNQGFLYPLKKKSLFKKDLFIWLGPSTDFFFYYSKPNIGSSGINISQSVAGLFSLGFNTDVIYFINPKVQFESSLRLTALSLGVRLTDVQDDDQSFIKPLTLFSGLNSSFNLGTRYFIFNQLSVKLAYKFELLHINAWNPLLSASDNLVIGLTYRF